MTVDQKYYNELMQKYFPGTVLDRNYIRNDSERGEIILDKNLGVITLLLRWKYMWIKSADVNNDWTELDKIRFMTRVNFCVCHEWNGKIYFSVSGDSEFAKKFQGKKLPFNIQIIPVWQKEHWNVEVLKIPPQGDDGRPYVIWKRRLAHFYFKDTSSAEKCNPGNPSDCGHFQVNIPHEVGHMLALDDEYELDGSGKPLSKYKPDTAALMNIGMELRTRYLDYMNIMMNAVYPSTKFSVMSVAP
ncbi:hypothetical protein DQ806_14455 [Salmonella enterica subsp. enterica serovar Okatie]|nr:hypothetical protein [Salmonella enterica subsp. enterica serovar Okatie]